MLCFTLSACKKEVVPPKYEEIDRSPIETLDGVSVSSNPTDYVLIEVAEYGTILVRLYPDVAPETVENFKKLVSEGFYDGLIFHRVIEDFMIQGGDPEGNGTGGSETKIKGEFSKNGFENNLKHTRGVVSMARSGQPDSASSQFFICHKTAGVSHLDGNYASFGFVVYGMDVVDEIAEVKVNSADKPLKDIVITSIKFASVPEAKKK
jgi:peptidyl-prolyl cis-trans isomerase B (cyclophilin B)